MQGDLAQIEAAGLQIVGISYDDTAILKRFADKSKITFPLLSDPKSQVIDDFHILNEAAKGKLEGIPFPGTFIIDPQGVIRAKLFLEGYKDRHTTGALLEAARGIQ